MRLLCVFIVMTLMSVANAAELISVSVDRSDGTYRMLSEARFATPIEPLYTVLTDWDQSTKFSKVVVESRNMPPDELGRPGFYARNRVCLLFFCKTTERYGHVELEPYTMIRAIADPGDSDFHISNETWRFQRDGEHTIVAYQLEMKPKFWIPPLIGPYLIERKLKSSGVEALTRIEDIANRQMLANE